MKKLSFRKRLCCSVAAVLSLFAVCGNNLHAANDSPQSPQESKGGTMAPKFTLTSMDGKSISLANFPNQYVVLNFWASLSQESRKVNAEIAELEKKYPNSKVAFVDISIDENADIAKQYGVSSDPAVFLISPDGFIYDVVKSGVELEQTLNRLF